MIIQKLHKDWQMKRAGDSELLPAKVPGSVYSDLLDNKKMEDPYWRDNEDKAFALLEYDYEYMTAFKPTEAILNCERILLRCEGLDTLADVYLNNILIGKANNMHRTWEYDVKRYLKEDNELHIVFHSPIKFVNDAYKKVRTDGSEHCLNGFPQLRKAHCMFGWDWGPRLPDAGIWRNIELAGINGARLDGVFITQKHKRGTVELDIKVAADAPGAEKAAAEEAWALGRKQDEDKLSYTVYLTSPQGNETKYENSPRRIVIQNPELWWPNGFGAHPLYTVKVVLSKGGAELDSWQRRYGLRTATIKRQKDKWGESFAHEVNGVQIFAMGADYIPEDNILSRVTEKRTRKLLEQCVAANFNTIRVWGGGYYPNDFFFDICDELGLIVWLDFMFACAVYDLTDEFDKNIRAELAVNIKRIRHHASLGLYCGNNEMEMFVNMNRWVSNPKQKADYIKMYEYIFPQVLSEYDPETFYWPASPSSGGSFDAPNDPNRGDVHYWDVWHGDKPFSDYRNFYFRYASEFGFQSFPLLKTVESFTLPEDRNIFSYIMERHQRNNAANGKIMNYMYQTFLYPNGFGTVLYASQLLQAEAIKYGVEHFRRNRGRCMGAIYWQLNDIWPAASWASIDYHFRWKALHYFARRFFQPVMISCREEGILTQNPNANAQPLIKEKLEKSFRLCVANETMEEKKLTVKWEIRDKTARTLKEKTERLTCAPLSSTWLDKVEAPEIALNDEYLSFRLYENKELISEGTVIFTLPKFFNFVDPKLSFKVEGDTITVKAEAYARSVEILNRKEDIVLSDNYFDMNAGEKQVKIISGNPDGIKLRSVYNIR
ncbi:MAG: glycoside hydrolase family 2 protein [Treponema sp.]|jgi:beta-mannosidase|nr:glycoside hydrolase family 2 protein [Treponema sp.]